MDLGFKDSCGPCCPDKSTETKTRYPSFVIRDVPELASSLISGQTITATVTLKVSSLEQHEADGFNDKAGSRIELSVIDLKLDKSKPKSTNTVVREMLKQLAK